MLDRVLRRRPIRLDCDRFPRINGRARHDSAGYHIDLIIDWIDSDSDDLFDVYPSLRTFDRDSDDEIRTKFTDTDRFAWIYPLDRRSVTCTRIRWRILLIVTGEYVQDCWNSQAALGRFCVRLSYFRSEKICRAGEDIRFYIVRWWLTDEVLQEIKISELSITFWWKVNGQCTMFCVVQWKRILL